VTYLRHAVVASAFTLIAGPACAASLDGAGLGLLWGLPFAGMLLCIALGPLVAPHAWEHHMGKVAALFAVCAAGALAIRFGFGPAGDAVAHAIVTEYVPFVLLLFALYTAAGGIVITGNLRGAPALNTALLAIGTAMASVIGTTGASMVMIRPMIRANDGRRYNAHVVIFFIFLVSNVGGALTPLGDPPLFLGFLRGVDFFWTTHALLWPTLGLAGALLVIFFGLDSWMAARERGERPRPDPTPDQPQLGLRGWLNIPLIAIAIFAILLSVWWEPGVQWSFGSTVLELQNIVREGLMLAVGIASLVLTPREHREGNDFSWAPMKEVAKLFAAIFICIVPVAAMLRAGEAGAFAPLIGLVSHGNGEPRDMAYFWLTGGLSSVLDNAPTYLVFFELAGGNAKELMGPLASTLAAISMGAVFMGAMTYIGNAPNFMVYAIARQARIRMPGFFGYMLWSGLILLPLLAALAFLCF
jgi:Na+/H+ antiporter NhaD/arsenite permease-like protein